MALMDRRKFLEGVYKRQVASSKKRGHVPPKYSKGSFIEKSLKNPTFLSLFNTWEDNNYEHDLMPSCDRLRDNFGYSFQNTQWITLKENLDKPKGMQQKRILQKDKLGTILAIYFGIGVASRILQCSPNSLNEAIKDKSLLRECYFEELPDTWKDLDKG